MADRSPSREPARDSEPLPDDDVSLGEDMAAPEDLSRDPVVVTVESRAHGWRLDHYITRLYPNYSRALFQRSIAEGGVLVNGVPVKAARRLRMNDRLSIRLPEEPDNSLIPEDVPLEILYEDDALAVINKPPDMVTHPGKGNFHGTLAAAVQFHFDTLSDVAGQLRPGIVHRLDRDTSGVIAIAKSNQTHHRLSGQFERREVLKEYRAIVRGVVERDADVIATHMRMHPKAREKMIVCEPDEGTREAVTRYEVLERFDGFTYLRLLPRTGRTHQLRVHLQHLRHPIVADRLYGGQAELTLSELQSADRSRTARLRATNPPSEDTLISRQALHAFRLSLRHPVTDQPLDFEAPLPLDMQRTLDALRRERIRPR